MLVKLLAPKNKQVIEVSSQFGQGSAFQFYLAQNPDQYEQDKILSFYSSRLIVGSSRAAIPADQPKLAKEPEAILEDCSDEQQQQSNQDWMIQSIENFKGEQMQEFESHRSPAQSIHSTSI